jgi:hypothetical protein
MIHERTVQIGKKYKSIYKNVSSQLILNDEYFFNKTLINLT